LTTDIYSLLGKGINRWVDVFSTDVNHYLIEEKP
jgi:hypothetical protein